MNCLGLDIGSTTIKGAVLDLDRGRLGATATRPFPAPIQGLAAGWFEVDPTRIESAVREVVQELVRAAPDASRLFCSGQMGGLVLVDDDGSPLTNYLSWRDQRAGGVGSVGSAAGGCSYLHAIKRQWGDELLASLGNELQLGSTSTLLFWLASKRLLPARGTPATVADFVISRLCRQPPWMHVTQAIGLLDLKTTTWHRVAFESLRLDGIHWPRLSRRIEPVGRTTIEGTELMIYGAYGDQACALRGAGFGREELSINISTGSQVSRRAARFEPGDYQSRCYFDDEWLNTVTHLPAGRSLNCLVDLLTELASAEGLALRDPWGQVLHKAAEARDSDLQVELSFYASPLAHSGNIRNITTENLTVGNLFLAAFRAMADNYARVAERLEPDRPWRSVALSGGLARATPLLRQLIGQRFAAPLRVAADEEALLGLLELARDVEAADRNPAAAPSAPRSATNV